MEATAIDQFWGLVRGAIALSPTAFQRINQLPYGTAAALYVVLLAGLSQAIGQGIVLFINRVKPFRFLLSLVIAAVLFAVSVGFWGVSTWLVARFLFGEQYAAESVLRSLGLAFAPQIFACFVALPYLGVPISIVLSVWSFLAFLTGLQTTLGLDLWQSFFCTALGWAVYEVLRRTIGRPVAAIGRQIANRTAGVKLVTNLRDLEAVVEAGVQRVTGQPRDRHDRRSR